MKEEWRNSWNFYELKFFHWINNSFFSKTQIFQGICSPSSAHLKEFIGIFIFIPRSPVFMVAHQIVTQTCGVSLHVPKLRILKAYKSEKSLHLYSFCSLFHIFPEYKNWKSSGCVHEYQRSASCQKRNVEQIWSIYFILHKHSYKNIINRGACQKEDHSEKEENSMIYSLERVTNSL